LYSYFNQMEKTDKYFSENTIEFLDFVEKMKDVSNKLVDNIEANKEIDEEDLSFMFNSFCSLT
jgi:hypothetical protein